MEHSYDYSDFDNNPKIMCEYNDLLTIDIYISNLNICDGGDKEYFISQCKILKKFKKMKHGEKIVMYGYSFFNGFKEYGIREEYFLTNYERMLIFTYNIYKTSGLIDILDFNFAIPPKYIHMMRKMFDCDYGNTFKNYAYNYVTEKQPLGIFSKKIIDTVDTIKKRKQIKNTISSNKYEFLPENLLAHL